MSITTDWTAAHDAEIRRLMLTERKSAREISVIMDRKFDFIRNRMRACDIRLSSIMTLAEAKAARLEKAQKIKSEKSAARRARVLALAAEGMDTAAISAATGMSAPRVRDFVREARKAAAPPPVIKAVWNDQSSRMVGLVMARHSRRATQYMTPEQHRTRDASVAHARRTAPLPPVSPDEAERLVAEFLARKSVTVLPPGFSAVVNNGTGL